MKYAFNLKKEPFVFANGYEINASYKDLGAVCDAIRYLKVGSALELLENLQDMKIAIPYRRHNKYMGSRHELHGAKGAYPIKAAAEVKIVLTNAAANSASKGLDSDQMYVVHASANKTHIESRRPSKGSLSWGRGRYGMSASTHSDIEYAKVEIGLGTGNEDELSKNMKYFMKVKNGNANLAAKPQKIAKKAKAVKKEKEEKPKVQKFVKDEHKQAGKGTALEAEK